MRSSSARQPAGHCRTGPADPCACLCWRACCRGSVIRRRAIAARSAVRSPMRTHLRKFHWSRSRSAPRSDGDAGWPVVDAGRRIFHRSDADHVMPGECVSAVKFPVWEHRSIGVGFFEVSAGRSDFAFASALAQVALDEDGRCVDIALGVGGVGDRALRLDVSPLLGTRLDAAIRRRSRHAVASRHGGVKRSACQRVLSPSRRDHAWQARHRTGKNRSRRPRAEGSGMMKVELRVNGVSRTADVEPRKTLLDTLRENFLLNGAMPAASTASAAPVPCWSTVNRCVPV